MFTYGRDVFSLNERLVAEDGNHHSTRENGPFQSGGARYSKQETCGGMERVWSVPGPVQAKSAPTHYLTRNVGLKRCSITVVIGKRCRSIVGGGRRGREKRRETRVITLSSRT